jgi:type IV pilus assembly protein PilV
MRKHSVRGFTMIEVLIALFIFAVGMLGAGALQLSSLNNNKNNLFRTQAIMLAEEIIDQMRANPAAAKNGNKFESITVKKGTLPTRPSCATTATGCSASDIADFAIYNWGNSVATSLPEGTGTVTRGLEDTFTITISWREKDRGADTTSNYTVAVTL